MRELDTKEMLAVAGGDYYTYEDDPEGRGTWLNHYNSDGFLQQTTLLPSASSGGPGYFGSAGASFLGFGGAGLSYGGGDLYGYVSVGYSPIPSPVDVSFGYASDVNAYLGGFSVSGNGIPGYGVSLSTDGVGPSAIQFGTPGVQAQYEVNLTESWNAFMDKVSKDTADALKFLTQPPTEQQMESKG